MTYNLPQHLFLGLAALPRISSQPLYQQYNLRPRSELSSDHSNHISIHHRLLQRDFQFDFDIIDTECRSPLIEWSMDHIKEMGYSTYKELFDSKILEMPYIYKHYIDKNEAEESFGVDGSATEELVRRHNDTMAFWTEADADDTIKTDGILLLSMHGKDLMDNDKLVPTIIHLFDFDNEVDVLEFAEKVKEYVTALPGGYDNPLLTMNAVATRGGGGSRKTGKTVASLIIGDGVLQFVNDSNLSGSGPDFIHAHEFGHHLQYEMDLVHNVPPGYENDIRRKEIMADAISAYFLAHDRGANMDAHQISEFSMTAFATGDCNTGQDDHHGTPKQRYCASVWGASRAILARNGSPLIDPETFVELFNTNYDSIFNLDQTTCTLILEEPDEDGSYAAAYQPEPSNADTGSVEASNFQPSLPASVEVTFPSGNDFETTDGSTTSETGHSGSYDATTIEPPHETTYKHGLPGSNAQVESLESNGSKKQDHEALILVSGRPSETLHDLSGEDSMYACNLPWVYCDDANSSHKTSSSNIVVLLLMSVSALVLLLEC